MYPIFGGGSYVSETYSAKIDFIIFQGIRRQQIYKSLENDRKKYLQYKSNKFYLISDCMVFAVELSVGTKKIKTHKYKYIK